MRDQVLWRILVFIADAVLILLLTAALVLSLAVLLSGCGARERAPTKVTHSCAPLVITVEVKVLCMDPPPKFELPTWPDPDHAGNLLMHASTAYISREYARCARLANDL